MGGAVEKVWFALGKQFARCGHEVMHISRSLEGWPVSESIGGVQHVRVAGFDQPRQLALLKLADFIYSLRVRCILPQADILVTNTFWLPLLVRNERFGRICVNVQRTPKGQMTWYAHVARLTAVSHAIADAITAEAPQLANKVRVIGNALPFDVPAGCAERREKIVLYVGRIHPEKGLEELVKAAGSLPHGLQDWKVRIVGPHESRFGGGGVAFLEQLKRAAERSVLKIEWMGAIFDDAELQRHYETASVFVYPSTAGAGEALPVAPLEAMAHCCPALVSNLACFRDYIDDTATGFVFDQKGGATGSALGRRLAAILQMPAMELRKVGAAAQERVKAFAVQSIADQYLADFRSLLADRNA